jgi:hypothetical protein
MSKNRDIISFSGEKDVKALWDSIETGKRSIIANQILRENLPKYADGKVKPENGENLRGLIESIVRDIVGESQTVSNLPCIDTDTETKKVVEKHTDAVMDFISQMTKKKGVEK